VEAAKHILWDCPSAANVWGADGRLIQKSYVTGYSFAEVMEYLFDRCSGEEVEVHAEIARRIWFRRNLVVHDGEFSHPNNVIRVSATFINDYRNSLQRMGDFDSLQTTREVPALVRWVPPPFSIYKINCDVALDNKNGRMGVGLVIKDSNGKVYAAASQVVDFIVDPVVGESIAAL
jgi:hypothetical protein